MDNKEISAKEFLKKISPTNEGIRAKLEQYRFRAEVENLMEKYYEHKIQSLSSVEGVSETMWTELIHDVSDVLYKANGSSSGAIDIVSHLKKWMRDKLQVSDAWVSAKESKPKEKVLVYTNSKNIFEATWNEQYNQWSIVGETLSRSSLYYITHWMPLPPPPNH